MQTQEASIIQENLLAQYKNSKWITLQKITNNNQNNLAVSKMLQSIKNYQQRISKTELDMVAQNCIIWDPNNNHEENLRIVKLIEIGDIQANRRLELKQG